MQGFQKTKDNKGLTLIEIIVSLAIIGIIAMTMLSMFTFGYTVIMDQGRVSTAVFTAQQNIEKSLPVGSEGTELLEIRIPDGPSIHVTGESEETTVAHEERNISKTVFIPNR